MCEGDDVTHKLPKLQTLRAPSTLPFRTEHLVCGVPQGSPFQNMVFLSDRQPLKGREKPVLILKVQKKPKKPRAPSPWVGIDACFWAVRQWIAAGLSTSAGLELLRGWMPVWAEWPPAVSQGCI